MLLLGTECICARDPGQETMCFVMLCIHTCMFLNGLFIMPLSLFLCVFMHSRLLPYLTKCSELLKVLFKFPFTSYYFITTKYYAGCPTFSATNEYEQDMTYPG